MPVHCPNCGSRIYEEERFCFRCGKPIIWTHEDPVIPSFQVVKRVQCPKCDGGGLISDPDCDGTGRVLGIWHEEAHQRCLGTGKILCDYPGCENGWILYI